MDSHFIRLTNTIRDALNDIDNSIIKRNRKIGAKEVFYEMCLYNASTEVSHSNALSYLRYDRSIKVSGTAIAKRKKQIGLPLLQSFKDKMISLIYNNNNFRFFAVDETTLNVNVKLAHEGFSMNKNRTYCHYYVTSIFDINSKIIVNMNAAKYKHERRSLLEQIDYINVGDTLIGDGGYFSKDLIKTLHLKGINYLFRIKKTMKFLNFAPNEESKIILYDIERGVNIEARIIKLRIDDSFIYLFTSLLNFPLDIIKDLYKRRWGVETNFKELKHNLSMVELKSQKEFNLKQDILIHNILNLINGYIYNYLNDTTKEGYFIDRKNCMNLLINRLMNMLTFEEVNKENPNNLIKIEGFCGTIKNVLIQIQPNREYLRKRIKPDSKWYRPRGYNPPIA
jgi:hypothetical protein